MNKKYLFKAFTLAEVLITLGIIGVVAAITIPTLVQNAQKQELASAFKKAYTTISNAYMSVRGDNSGELADVFTSQADEISTLCSKYLKCIKTCSTSDTSCYPTISLVNLYGDAFNIAATNLIVLQDGSVIYFNINNFSHDCTGNRATDGLCSELFIDINGVKKPNQIGRDVFNIMVTNHKVVPDGANGTVDQGDTDSNHCNPASNGLYNGFTCGNKILKEGAMNY